MNAPKGTKTQTTKIWVTTLEKLRLIYGLTGERMSCVLDRLVSREFEEVMKNSEYQKIGKKDWTS